MVRFLAFLNSDKPTYEVLCFIKKSRNLMTRFPAFLKFEKPYGKVFEKEVEETLS